MPDAKDDPRSEACLPAFIPLKSGPNELEQPDWVILDLAVKLRIFVNGLRRPYLRLTFSLRFTFLGSINKSSTSVNKGIG